jgi:hypothetical protein
MVAVALERITFYIVTTNMAYLFMDVLNVTNSTSGIPVTTYLVFSGMYKEDNLILCHIFFHAGLPGVLHHCQTTHMV